jgi:hypothetical protein
MVRYIPFVTEKEMPLKPGKNAASASETAEIIATQALAFLASDPVRLGRFLAESGLGPENIRKTAEDPSFLPAILDFILAHETELLDFAAHIGIDPRHVGVARRALLRSDFDTGG